MGKLRSNDRWFSAIVTLAFLVGAGLIAMRHELWCDEFGPWMIGRASHSLSQLMWNIRYEGHAPGWQLIIYALTRITSSLETMQILHLLLASASVYLITRFSPMPRLWRLLYSFGFYPFYQYAVLVRGYSLCVMLLFGFCALYHLRRTRLILPAAMLCMLAIADTYGWFMSVALAFALAVSWIYDRCRGIKWSNGRAATIAAAALIALGIIWSALVTMPPPDSGCHSTWNIAPSLSQFMHVLYSLSFDLNFLNPAFYVAINLAAFVFIMLWFARRRVAFLMFCAFVFILAAFYYVKFSTVAFWHKGMMFEYFIACLWIFQSYEDEPLRPRLLERASLWCKRMGPAFVVCVLAFYVVYGMKWEINDIRRPYATGKLVAQYVRDNYPKDIVIAGDSDFAATSISGYLDRPVYYPASGRFGTYIIYDKKRSWPISMDLLCGRVEKVSSRAGKKMLLATSYQLPDSCAGRLDARLVKTFGGSVMVGEDFWLYEIKRE
ncbi:MAG: hypothetical protein ABFD49_05060 [Armatimonadota bacterium]|nr:hypothetical protein [bacterium]